MDKKVFIPFTLIVFLAFFLRFFKVDQLPPSLNWDEVSIGYNAYSVLKTGQDEWGKSFPLSFRAFGDYKLPGYIYLDVPFVAMFGLNEVSVRLPSVLAGVGIVVVIFLILWELTTSLLLSLTGAFLAAVLPWLIIFSRIGLEANLALFLTTTSFYFFLLSLRKKFCLILSAIFLGLSIFTYNSSRVLILPFLILAVVLFRNELSGKKGEIPASFLILMAFVIMAFSQALLIDSKARYRWTTIIDEGAILSINKLRQQSSLPSQLSWLLYNKATYFLTEASKNYFVHFNPRFLFLEGGSNYQFSVPGSGLLYWAMFPFILLGIFQTLLQKKKWQLFVLGWLLLAPLPAAITRDAPHALRSIFLIIPFLVLTVGGVDFLRQALSRRFLLGILGAFLVVLVIEAYLFGQNYTGDYVKKYSWSWQYGYKQAIDFVKDNQDQYDRVVFTRKYGEPHIFVLFYLGYNPQRYQTDNSLVRYEKSDWFWVDRFGKFEFVDDRKIEERIWGGKVLLVTSPDNYPKPARLLKSIDFINGERALDIVAVE